MRDYESFDDNELQISWKRTMKKRKVDTKKWTICSDDLISAEDLYQKIIFAFPQSRIETYLSNEGREVIRGYTNQDDEKKRLFFYFFAEDQGFIRSQADATISALIYSTGVFGEENAN